MGALCNCNERGIIDTKEVILGMPGYVFMPLPTVDMCAGVFSWGVVDNVNLVDTSFDFSGQIRGFVDIVNLVDKTLILVDKIFALVDIFSCFVDKV